MTKLSIESDTITRQIWLPTQRPAPPVNHAGCFLHVSTAASSRAKVTAVAAHPSDDNRFSLALSDGRVFCVSLQDNQLNLAANLQQSVCCLAYGGGLGFPILLAITQPQNVLCLVEWPTGFVLFQQSLSGIHSRPVIRLCSGCGGQSPDEVVMLSTDTISVWRSGCTTDRPVTSSNASASDTFHFRCVAKLSPCSRKQNAATTMSSSKCNDVTGTSASTSTNADKSVVASFVGVCAHGPSLVTVENNNVVSRWQRSTSGFSADGFAREACTVAARVELNLDGKCSDDVAYPVECGDALILARRSRPQLLLLNAQTLEGVGQIHLPIPEKRTHAAVTINSLHAAAGAQHVMCALSTGHILCVTLAECCLAFIMVPPDAQDPRGSFRFHMGNAALALFSRGSDLHVYSVSAARDGYLLTRNIADTEELLLPREERERQPSNVTATSEADNLFTPLSASLQVRAVPFMQIPTHGYIKSSGNGGVAQRVTGSSGAPRKNTSITRFPRKALRPTAAQVALWVGATCVVQASTPSRTTRVVPGASNDVVGSALAAQNVNAQYNDVLSDASCAYNMTRLCEYVKEYGSFPRHFRPYVWRFALELPDSKVTVNQFAALAARQLHPFVRVLLEPFVLPAGPCRRTVEVALSVLAWHSPALSVAAFLPLLVFPFAALFSKDPQMVVEVVLSFLHNWGAEYLVEYPDAPSNVTTFMSDTLQNIDPELHGHLDLIGATKEVWAQELLHSLATDCLSTAEWCQVFDHAFLTQPLWLFIFFTVLLASGRASLLRCTSGEEVLAVLRRRHFFHHIPTSVHSGGNSSKSNPFHDIIARAHQTHATLIRSPAGVQIPRRYLSFRPFHGPRFRYPSDFVMDATALENEELKIVARLQADAEAHAAREAAAREAGVSANSSFYPQEYEDRRRARQRTTDSSAGLADVPSEAWCTTPTHAVRRPGPNVAYVASALRHAGLDNDLVVGESGQNTPHAPFALQEEYVTGSKNSLPTPESLDALPDLSNDGLDRLESRTRARMMMIWNAMQGSVGYVNDRDAGLPRFDSVGTRGMRGQGDGFDYQALD